MIAKDLYLGTILAGDRETAVGVALDAIRGGMDVHDLYVDVLQEALYEVGRLWESNRITVSVEHRATAITQLVVARLYDELPRAGARRGGIVLTGIAGELHQVGGHMVADALESDGWDVRFLGADVLVPAVLEAIGTHRPEVLGVSCTMLQNVPNVTALIRTVQGSFGDAAPRFVVGGGAFRAVPGLAREAGADAWAPDLRAAVAVLRSLPGNG